MLPARFSAAAHPAPAATQLGKDTLLSRRVLGSHGGTSQADVPTAIEAARKNQGQERVLRRQLRWGWEPWPELCRGVVKIGNDVQTALRQTLRPSGWPFRFKIFRSVLHSLGLRSLLPRFSAATHPARPSGDASSPRIFPVSHISFPLPLPALSRPPSCEVRDGGVRDTLLQGSFRAMSEQLSRTCRPTRWYGRSGVKRGF